jgi:adenylyltransferase/sulfurtransferase
LGTFEFISWWEREKVENAKVMVVGAGALGNEVIKNLVLMGIGHIFIVDFDTIELANLSRSVLFRESDSGRKKAEVAAARAKEINPNIHVQYVHGDVTTDIGLGVFRRMDVIIGCLDNREARLAINRFAYWIDKPWVDGAIQEFFGLARVFVPGQGACFECSLTEQARRDLALRYSCPLLARENVLLGKVPTTPTIASIIAAIQAQEALKTDHGSGAPGMSSISTA